MLLVMVTANTPSQMYASVDFWGLKAKLEVRKVNMQPQGTAIMMTKDELNTPLPPGSVRTRTSEQAKKFGRTSEHH